MENPSASEVKPTFFHSEEWIGLLQDVYSYRRLDLNSKGFRIPLLRVGPLFGDRLVSIPFSDYGGPVGNVDARRLKEECVELLETTGADYVEVRVDNQNLVKTLLGHGFMPAATYFTRVVDTHPEGGWEDAWKLSLDKKARQGVVKAEKAGLSVTEVTEEEDVDAVYGVYFKCVKSIGSPCHPKTLFKSMKAKLGERAKIYLAKYGDRNVGMAVYLLGEDRAHLWARYALDEYKKLGVIYLLDWAGIKLASTLKIKRFDFGRTRKNSGVEVYKHHWKGEDTEIHHLCLPRKRAVTPPDPAQTNFKLYSKIWRILPDPLVEAIGPRVIKCIAL